MIIFGVFPSMIDEIQAIVELVEKKQTNKGCLLIIVKTVHPLVVRFIGSLSLFD